MTKTLALKKAILNELLEYGGLNSLYNGWMPHYNLRKKLEKSKIYSPRLLSKTLRLLYIDGYVDLFFRLSNHPRFKNLSLKNKLSLTINQIQITEKEKNWLKN